MRKIYHLSINITEGDVRKNISAFYEDFARAKKELDRWGKTYKEKWQVPNEPDVVWMETKFNCQSGYFYVGRPNGKLHMYSGSLYDGDYILEDGEEIQEVSGCVFRYTEFPNICGYNSGPWLVGDTKIELRELIDVENKVRITEPIVSKEGVQRVSPEDEERYYKIRSEIIANNKYRK